MDFTNIGTVSGFVRALDTKRRAEQRGQGKIDKTEKKPSSIEDWMKKQDELVKSTKSASGEQDTEYFRVNDQKLAGIQTKFYSGGKLTKSEREYLRAKNPMLYERLLASEAEKKIYTRDLKRCRTRKEVHRLKMSHTAGAMSSAKADRTAAADRMNAVQSSTNEFVRSGEYHSLPTEHEKAVAEKRVKQAEERRQRKISERSRGKTRPSENKTDSASKKLFRDIRPDETVEQAKNSPEMLKVRRAKAKRAYSASAPGAFRVVISEKA